MYLLDYKNQTEGPKVVQLNTAARKGYLPLLLFLILLLTWFFLPALLRSIDQTTGSIDQSIWLLILLSLISFLLITAVAWWLLKQVWSFLRLTPLNMMVSQFNTLSVWQQLSFYWGSYFLLLLAALGCLSAVC